MSLVLADRVRETTQTTGTGTITLDGAVQGFQSFSVIGNNNTTYYTINRGAEWEVGIGTYYGGTLSRDTVYASSTGFKVNFSAGAKDVFVTYPASKSVNEDANNRVLIPYTSGTTNVGSLNVGNATVHTDSGVIAGFTASEPLYLYTSLQNTSASNTSYASYAVNDGGHTAYGELGINNANYSYSAAGFPNNGFSLPLATFVESSGGPLVLGSWDSQKISFIVNGAVNTADAMTIETTGAVTIPTAAVTGGAINGATVGATTAAAGAFTTLTAQTEVLKGTGQNLLLQSQALATSPWTVNGVSATNNSATAPDSTSTATLLTASAGTSAHYDFSGGTPAFVQSVTYCVSFYAKSNTARYVQFAIGGTASVYANFDTTAGTVGTTAGLTSSSITSAGSGWYRCVVVFSYSSTGASGVGIAIQSSSSDTRLQSWTAAGTETVYIWGVQTEIGSVANTYIPTTTTAVYGTPTLSFSGVAGIGLQSDGSLYVQPAGTGAVQAQATTSTATGGNARGANAVDWQTTRSAANRVASSSGSVVGGGYDNASSSSYGALVGGYSNSNNAYMGFVGAGRSNISAGDYSTLVAGRSNTSYGVYGFVGGGFTNANQASSGSTTTQSATMNGTTAVTLSGSNASIKVGQFVYGTYIASDTYVAAVSGTSLTLSQAASGSGTTTLSFYTPHGVVVGGGNNQATGSYSFIGGGGDAGTAANRNVASGDWSFVGGGRNNTASGAGSVVGGGGYYSGIGASNVGNTSAGDGSFVGGGFLNQAQSFGSSVLGGYTNTANGTYSAVLGSAFGTARSIQGNTVSPASNNPMNIGSAGVCQTAILVLARQTTDATATVLTSNSSAAATTNQVILPNNSAYTFRGEIVSGVTGGGNSKSWTIEGLIKRGANAAATTLVGSTVTSMYADVGAATWTIALSADTTNGGLAVTFTGQAGTTIRTVCQVRTTEMTY